MGEAATKRKRRVLTFLALACWCSHPGGLWCGFPHHGCWFSCFAGRASGLPTPRAARGVGTPSASAPHARTPSASAPHARTPNTRTPDFCTPSVRIGRNRSLPDLNLFPSVRALALLPFAVRKPALRPFVVRQPVLRKPRLLPLGLRMSAPACCF